MGNVKHLANPLVKQAAQLVTKFVNKNNEEARLAGFFIYVLKTYIVWYIFMTLFITFSVEMWYNYLESSIY